MPEPRRAWLAALARRARALRQDVALVWLAARDPRVPMLAKLLAAAVAAYALSPIDLIPDFIPVLGLLDDLVLVPLGIVLVLRLVPAAVMADLRAEAAAIRPGKSRLGLMMVVALWLAAALCGWLALRT